MNAHSFPFLPAWLLTLTLTLATASMAPAAPTPGSEPAAAAAGSPEPVLRSRPPGSPPEPKGAPVSAAATAPAGNPQADYDGFARLTRELAPLRQASLVDEDQFLKLAAQPGTVILDARSRDRYERRHVKGAVSLPFTDFTQEALDQLIPDKNTLILIYCNNNFAGDPIDFARKSAVVALNLPTFVNLHAYGFKNVKELGRYLDISKAKLIFEGTAVKQ